MRVCPRCQSTYSSGEDFCPLDGAPLGEPPAAAAPEAAEEPTLPKDPLVGRLIAGRYLLRQYLGGGTMGVVYRAEHNVLERDFAVKLLRKEFARDERSLQRFYREAKVASLVDHSHIVRIHDFGQTEEHEPYLVMEHVTGQSLFERINSEPGRVLPLPLALHIMLQVARALNHAHSRGVVHRDIKPENIVLTEQDGQPDFVKMLDFGVAKILGLPPLSAAGEVLGTPEFLAPEGLVGDEVGAPADLYALGAMLHDAIVGSPPFAGTLRDILHQHLAVIPDRLSQRRPDLNIPAELDGLVSRLLAKEPAERPTAEETVTELQRIYKALTTPPEPEPINLLATMLLPGRPGIHQLATLVPDLRPADRPTVFSQEALQDEDARTAAIGRVAAQMQKLADFLALQIWDQAQPEPLAALQAQVAELEEQEMELGTQLALANDDQEGPSGSDTARAALQGQVVELRLRSVELRKKLARYVLEMAAGRALGEHEKERRQLEVLEAQLQVLQA